MTAVTRRGLSAVPNVPTAHSLTSVGVASTTVDPTARTGEASGVTLIGYRDQHHVYLLPEVTYREVNRVQPLKFTVAAIGTQLHEDGWLIPGNSSSHLTVQMRVRDNRVRLWRLKTEILTGDSGDGGDVA